RAPPRSRSRAAASGAAGTTAMARRAPCPWQRCRGWAWDGASGFHKRERCPNSSRIRANCNLLIHKGVRAPGGRPDGVADVRANGPCGRLQWLAHFRSLLPMCGIVGAIADRDVVPVLVEGLKRLEYRGYDSAGLAALADGRLRRVRRTGRVSELEAAAREQGLAASLGIGHTRWATHGGVTEDNAHPHISFGELAVVHNGIIENHDAQRARLQDAGYAFESETDTEVIAHLVHFHRKQGLDLLAAVQAAVRELTGAYAIAVVGLDDPDRMVVARMGCPLLVGLGESENFVASDVSAIIQATRRVIFLEEGDTAELTRNGVRVFGEDGQAAEREVHVSDVSLASLELGPYSHFMQKEIHEQPRAISDTIEAVIDNDAFGPELFGADAAEVLAGIEGIKILACGTSYYAGLVAGYWIESISGLP